MAAVSSRHVQSTLTPPSSSHGAHDSWDYSVPNHQATDHYGKVRHEDFDYSNDLHFEANQRGRMVSQSSRIEPSSTHLDNYYASRNDKLSSQDGSCLAPARPTALNRKESNLSDIAGTPDSLLDFYDQESGGISDDITAGTTETHEAQHKDQEERWIHRDKLAQIESKELQAAGFVLPPSRPKTANRQGPKREKSRDRGANRSESRQRRRPMSPVDGAGENGSAEWDLRSPEEVAAAQNDGSSSKGSRIPLSKNSRLPIPLDYISRDTPVPRRKSIGWNGEDEGIAYPRTRDRSQSTVRTRDESAIADEPPVKAPTPQSTPPKKSSTRNTSVTSTRKPGQTGNKKRSLSGAKELSRPHTGSKDLGSGTTSSVHKRPEGDPPWLATMYKPDPRLPPDQQMLPTVAKRLQQEAWEKEGKFGNAYDSSFRPINENQFHQPPSPGELLPGAVEEEPAQPPQTDEWPLRGSKVSSTSLERPSTAAGNGSYSTMPKIQAQSATPASPRLPTGSPAIIQAPTSSAPPQTIRMQDPGEETKKKGCGCCSVM